MDRRPACAEPADAGTGAELTRGAARGLRSATTSTLPAAAAASEDLPGPRRPPRRPSPAGGARRNRETATAAAELGLRCRCHIPAGPDTEQTAAAEKAGAAVLRHRPGHNSHRRPGERRRRPARLDACRLGWTEAEAGRHGRPWPAPAADVLAPPSPAPG